MFGTSTVLDSLRASSQTIAQIGLDTAFEAIRLAFNAHNAIMKDMRSTLMEDTTDRLRRGGGYAAMAMQELDEFGTPDAQKVTAGATLGFPLRKYGLALQWTGLALKRMTGREIAVQAQAAMDADRINLISKMKQAIYYPVNYTSNDRFVDYLNQITLPVKAFQNADGFPIPPGPNGEVFNPASHTHYTPVASSGTFAVADADALVTNVREHFGTGKGYLGFNATAPETAAIQGFAKFSKVIDARIVQSLSSSYVDPRVASLELDNTNNRLIGIYDGVEVWVKPWVPAGYPTMWWDQQGMAKPLVYRYDPVLPSELTLTFEGEVHDLKADMYERYFGIAPFNRVAVAVCDVNHGSYTQPTGI